MTDEYMKEQQIRQMSKINRENNTSIDLFKNSTVIVNGVKIRMYSKKTNLQFFRDKRIKNNVQVQIDKLRLLIGMKSLRGIIYVKALL